VIAQRLKHFGRPGPEYGGPGDDDEIDSAEPDGLVTERLPDQALDPVPVDCPGRHPARDRYAKTAMIKAVCARVD